MQALAASVGFPDPALAAAVAMAESGGNTNAYGDAQYGGSLGLWQINLPSHPAYQSNPSALYDPTTNAKAAFATSSRGTNFQPWTTFRDGAYKRWYTPPAPPTSSFPLSHVALIGAGVASAALLGWLAYQEIKQPGYLLGRARA
jgi:hypothetical protein